MVLTEAVQIDPTTRRPRLLLSAYSCCPERGSEPGMGWGRAAQLAKYCDTWVLTEENDWKPRIGRYLAEHGPIEGDLDASGVVDFSDFLLLATNMGRSQGN